MIRRNFVKILSGIFASIGLPIGSSAIEKPVYEIDHDLKLCYAFMWSYPTEEEFEKYTGFGKCEWTPEEDPMECEKCRKTDKQIYFRRTAYDCNDGDYWCHDCVAHEAAVIKEETLRPF